MRRIGSEGIGAPLSSNRVGGDNFLRYIGDRLILDFHEGAGTTVRDLSGNGNDGTFGAGAAAPTWERNKLSFDGGDYIDCGNDLSLDITNKVTIEVLVKFATLTASDIIVIKGEWKVDGYYLQLSSNSDDVGIATNIGGSSTHTISNRRISINNRYHLICLKNGTAGWVYIDGVDETLTSDSMVEPIASTENLLIGAYQKLINFLNGDISFIRINATAFSASQVLQEYLWNKWRN